MGRCQNDRTSCLSCGAEAAGEAGLHAWPAGVNYSSATVTHQRTCCRQHCQQPSPYPKLCPSLPWSYEGQALLLVPKRHVDMCTPSTMPQWIICRLKSCS